MNSPWNWFIAWILIYITHAMSSWCVLSACEFSWLASSICRFYLSGPELWSVTVYYPFRLSANASINGDTAARFGWACSSRRPPPPPPPRLCRLRGLLLPLRLLQILRPLQMRFVQWSHKLGRTVLVHLEAAGSAGHMQTKQGKVSKQIENNWKNLNMSQCCTIVRCSKPPTLQGETLFAWSAELQTSGRSCEVQRPMQDTTLVACF
jgi:hypothetical protein